MVYLFYYCILSNSLCIYSVIFQKVFFSFTLIIIIIIIMEFQLFICVGIFPQLSHFDNVMVYLFFIFFYIVSFKKNGLIFSLFILLLLSLLLLFSY